MALRYANERARVDQIDSDPKDALAGLMLDSGAGFWAWLTRHLQETLDADCAFLGEVSAGNSDRVQTLHIRQRDMDAENFVYRMDGTRGAGSLNHDHFACMTDASALFPALNMLVGGALQSYVHLAIKDLNGLPLGVVAVLGRGPLDEARARALLQIFRARLGAELMRRRAIHSLQMASSSALTGQASLGHLLRSLCQAARMRHAFVAERELRNSGQEVWLTTLAVYEDGIEPENQSSEVTGSLLAEHFPPEGLQLIEGLPARCPVTASAASFAAESFLGYQVFGRSGEMLGQVVLLHDRDVPPGLLSAPLLQVLLVRIAGELQRLEYEKRNQLLRQRIMEAEHRDSIGSLASGIAHDFNNILFAVSGQAHLVDRVYEDNESLREQMSIILSACKQASGLCNQLLVYAGNQASSKVLLDLNEVVTGCERIAGIFTKGKGTVIYQLADEPLIMRGSLTRLQQVVMNLLKNAADAISSAGRIRVETRTLDCTTRDFDDALLGEDKQAGRYAVLEVEDNGSGIADSDLRKIFTPFFSTKDTGHGMGLSAVMGGAKEHGAAIFVRTALHRGTTFQVYFPIAESATLPRASAKIDPEPSAGAGLHLLVIDDDDLVRRTITRILTSEGFAVTSAPSGLEGLAIVEKMTTQLSAVVLDYFMPQMQGDEVLVRLRRVAPDLPVVLVSGNVSRDQVEAFPQQPNAFLSKPVLPQKLVDTVRGLIKTPSS